MREIKFRVYGSEYMSKPFTLQDLQERKIEFASSAAVMQFTGKHDSTTWDELSAEEHDDWVRIRGRQPSEWKGREIHEGDLLTVNIARGVKSTYEVYWDEDEGGFSLIDAKRDGDDFGAYRRRFGLSSDKVEVIGNIYENPLLPQPK